MWQLSRVEDYLTTARVLHGDLDLSDADASGIAVALSFPAYLPDDISVAASAQLAALALLAPAPGGLVGLVIAYQVTEEFLGRNGFAMRGADPGAPVALLVLIDRLRHAPGSANTLISTIAPWVSVHLVAG
jgi:hypothetical protein